MRLNPPSSLTQQIGQSREIWMRLGVRHRVILRESSSGGERLGTDRPEAIRTAGHPLLTNTPSGPSSSPARPAGVRTAITPVARPDSPIRPPRQRSRCTARLEGATTGRSLPHSWRDRCAEYADSPFPPHHHVKCHIMAMSFDKADNLHGPAICSRAYRASSLKGSSGFPPSVLSPSRNAITGYRSCRC